MSDASLMSIGDMIDAAFGEIDTNRVDFALLQTILFVMASKLKVLERRVIVELNHELPETETSFWTAEAKVHAKVPKKKKKVIKKKEKGQETYYATVKQSVFQEIKSFKTETTSKYAKTEFKKGETGTKKVFLVNSLERSVSKSSETVCSSSYQTKYMLKKDIMGVSSDTRISGTALTTVSRLQSDWTESNEYHHENIIIVQRTQRAPKVTDTEFAKLSDSFSEERKRPSSIVTQEQLESLVQAITELQSLYGVIDFPGLTDNPKFIEMIRESAPMSAGIAGLQLSARLETTEKSIEKLLELITLLFNRLKADASKKRVSLEVPSTIIQSETVIAPHLAQKKDSLPITLEPLKKDSLPITLEPLKKDSLPITLETLKKDSLPMTLEPLKKDSLPITLGPLKKDSLPETLEPLSKDVLTKMAPSKMTSQSEKKVEILPPIREDVSTKTAPVGVTEMDNEKKKLLITLASIPNKIGFITDTDLESAIANERQVFFQHLVDDVKHRINVSNESKKVVQTAVGTIDKAVKLDVRMINLEKRLNEYTDKINDLDARLSSQMTNYQEELYQMQADLNNGLDTMAETIACQATDETAVQEFSGKLNNLGTDLYNISVDQKSYEELQFKLSEDIADLKEKINLIRNDKSDRSEIAEIFDKLISTTLTSDYVSVVQFGAVQGTNEKRVKDLIESINSIEVIWEKSIKHLLKAISNKCDTRQVEGLRDTIKKNIETLKERVKLISDLSGVTPDDPRDICHKICTGDSKDIYHREPCISCDTDGTSQLPDSKAVKHKTDCVCQRCCLKYNV